VPSAWALKANGDDPLDSANITREIIAGIDHMDLIWKSSVYQLTADWLKKTL
jgi:hypothetical protein